MATARPLTRTLGAPQSIQGISFRAGTDVYFGLDDRLALCVIPDDQEILGVPCARGLVHFHPTGELAQATLARDFVHRGITFRRGALLTWDEEGALTAHLPDDHVIGDVYVPGSCTAFLCAEGRLQKWARRLRQEEVIAGLTCQADSVVTQFANGDVERATLARDVQREGLTLLGGTDVEFHRNGHLAVGTIAETLDRGGFRFEPGTVVVMRDDGSLSVAHLPEDLTVGEETFPAGSYLQFDADGRLTSHTAITWSVIQRAEG